MHTLSVEVITKAVNTSWKVKSQTVKASCQAERRNGKCHLLLNQRIAPSSVAGICGQTRGVNIP